jgi:hypothetical protein
VSTSAQTLNFSSSADAAQSASTTASTFASTSTLAPKFDFSNPAGATQSAAPTATTLLPQTFRFGGIGASSLPIPTQSTDVPFSFSNNVANASAEPRLSFGDGVVSSTPTFHFPRPIVPPLQAPTSTSPSFQGSKIPSEISYRQSEMWRAINAIIDTPSTTTTSNSSSTFGLQGFSQTSERPQAPTYTYCSRCGRSSHTRSSCYASYHAGGYRLYY